MTEKDAVILADVLGGEPWQSGGDIWLVLFRRGDGRLVVLSDDAVTEYENDDAFDQNRPGQAIPLH